MLFSNQNAIAFHAADPICAVIVLLQHMVSNVVKFVLLTEFADKQK